MLTLTSPVRTWAHGVRAWVKLGALCLWTVVLLRIDGVWLAGAVMLVLALAASGGRVFFAQWLAMLRPLWPLRRRLAGLGQQIITISHDPEAVADCDRVIWLEGGRVAMDGPAGPVLAAFAGEMARIGGLDADADLAS